MYGGRGGGRDGWVEMGRPLQALNPNFPPPVPAVISTHTRRSPVRQLLMCAPTHTDPESDSCPTANNTGGGLGERRKGEGGGGGGRWRGQNARMRNNRLGMQNVCVRAQAGLRLFFFFFYKCHI